MVDLVEQTLDFESEVLGTLQERTSVRLERLSRRLKKLDERAAQQFDERLADLRRFEDEEDEVQKKNS